MCLQKARVVFPPYPLLTTHQPLFSFRSPLVTRHSPLPLYFHQLAASSLLFALFFVPASFVFSRLQPLLPKCRGWGIPTPSPPQPSRPLPLCVILCSRGPIEGTAPQAPLESTLAKLYQNKQL